MENSSVSKQNTSGNSSSSRQSLPQTGDSNQTTVTVLGLLLSLFGIGFTRKSKKY
ncbi:LPXTG cell wall anchor domain-containing protein [Streptococcus dentasini]